MATNRRKSKRQGQSSAARLVICLAFVVAAIFIFQRVFVVKRISVSGNERMGDGEIIDISGIALGESIFSVDGAAVEEAFSREGAVGLVKLDVLYPNEVRLTVRERAAAAVVDHLGMSVVIDEWGTVIEVLRSLPEGALPVVTGLSATMYQPGQAIRSSVFGQVDAMVGIIGAIKSQSLGALVSELNVSDLDNLYLMTRGGMMVKLGDPLSIDAKLIWMQSAIGQLTVEGKMGGVLDVTSGEFAIHRAQ